MGRSIEIINEGIEPFEKTGDDIDNEEKKTLIRSEKKKWNTDSIKIRNKKFEIVDEFQYLGITMTYTNEMI